MDTIKALLQILALYKHDIDNGMFGNPEIRQGYIESLTCFVESNVIQDFNLVNYYIRSIDSKIYTLEDL
jgi:hypothetical protein